MTQCVFGKPGFRETAVLFVLLIPLYLLTPRAAFAQDRPLALGFGVEGNMNTISYASAASGFSLVLDMGRVFAAGLRTGYSYNFSGIGALEMAALGRWYFFSSEKSRLFAQIEAGADLIFYEGSADTAFLGGLVLGWRVNLGSGYLEPAIRGGYPYLWGLGLGFGWRI
ncbi:MAG: hypothetical protein LBK02_10380 [Treponema sp.]|jgi:hypothetical protein|nr:hypothetical protein [Treponema sp.]